MVKNEIKTERKETRINCCIMKWYTPSNLIQTMESTHKQNYKGKKSQNLNIFLSNMLK